MLTIVLIVAATMVIVAFLAAVAYGGLKAFWYWSQHHLLSIQQADSSRLVDLHIEDHPSAGNTGAKIEKIKLTQNDDPGLYL